MCFYWNKEAILYSPGLIISSDGIVDNSSGVSVGEIPWTEVIGIEENKIQSQKFISIKVSDPLKYANKGNVLRRMSNRANIKICGTPVNISVNSLKIGHNELLEIITEYYNNSLKK